MKKSLLFGLVIILLTLVPFLGNKAVKSAIEKQLNALKENGVGFRLQKEERSYLKTHLHYVVKVENEKKFTAYLQRYSSKELPLYTQTLLAGMEFGVDIFYGNIPMNEKIVLEFYPTKLSDTAMHTLKAQDIKLHEAVLQILHKRALFYHIKYDIASREFNGYLKDIDERFKIDNGKSDVHLLLEGVHTSGKGLLLAPEHFATTLHRITVEIEDPNNKLAMSVQNLSTSSSFESPTTYTSKSILEKLSITLKDTTQKFITVLENFSLQTSSNTQGDNITFSATSTLGRLDFTQNAQMYSLKRLRFEGTLAGVEKESFLKLQKLLQTKGQNLNEAKMQKLFLKMLAHGMTLKIGNFSLKQLATPKTKKIDGFTLSLNAKLKPNPALSTSITIDPAAVVNNIDTSLHCDFSKEFYVYLNTIYPAEIMLGAYKKEQNGRVVFDVESKGSMITINGKKVQ